MPVKRSAALAQTLDWSDRLLVGHGAIDRSHRDFVAVVNALRTCGEDQAQVCLERVQEHLGQHFETEEALMRSTNFPATDCHVEEHDKVVKAVSQVLELRRCGSVGLDVVHRLAQAMMDWFPAHLDYMDSALATWVCKHAYEGQPVVLRRNVAAAQAP